MSPDRIVKLFRYTILNSDWQIPLLTAPNSSSDPWTQWLPQQLIKLSSKVRSNSIRGSRLSKGLFHGIYGNTLIQILLTNSTSPSLLSSSWFDQEHNHWLLWPPWKEVNTWVYGQYTTTIWPNISDSYLKKQSYATRSSAPFQRPRSLNCETTSLSELGSRVCRPRLSQQMPRWRIPQRQRVEVRPHRLKGFSSLTRFLPYGRTFSQRVLSNHNST